MIRSLLKRTKFHRAAILLLAMLCTVSTAWGDVALKTKAKVEYIGEGGEVKTATDVLILNEDYLNEVNEEENKFIIGSEGQETWYYVENELDFSEDVIYLKGTVNIILGDKADLKAEKFSGDDATLNIYGAGKLTLNYDDYDVKEPCICCNDLNIYGGTISATSTHWAAIVGYKSVNIYGGKVTVTGENYISSKKISLGWLLPDDYINVSKYDGKVTILPEKGFRISGTETIIYRGDIDNNNTIAGQKLEPYIDPNNPPQPIVITKYVSSYEEFISAFASKKAKIVLDKDINYPLNTVISIKNDACLDLNGHSLKFLVPLAIAIAKDCNVEITDHSESKSGKIIYESAAWGKGVINFGTLSVSNICFNIKNGTTSIINNGTLSVSNVTFTGIYNQANGIIANHNSTVIIGSGVCFSGLDKAIYTHYDYHDDSTPNEARALTRGNDSESESESDIIEEPAKLYFNALPVFESCGYDLYLDKSIMDFSNATAPLALASGQNKITLKNHVSAFTGAYTKDYKRAFTDPATGTTTSPNDIFNYKEVGGDVEPKYLCGEIYFIKTKGYCGVADANEGKNVEWTVADNGNDMLKLTISKNEAEGQENYAMADYTTESPAPWANFAATINEVVVGDGVTPSSTFPFDNLINLTAVTVPVSTLEDYLANWSAKADVIKSTGKTNTISYYDITWTLTKTDGDKIGDNFPLKLTIEGNGEMDDYASNGAPWYAVHSYITEASLPEGLRKIGGYAFTDCAITSITIPASVSSIDYAFSNCKKLANVTFKGNITEIGSNAFNGCTSLKEISLPNSVTKIGGNAFCRSGLTRITIPALVSEIPMSAFSDCKSLAEVTIPEGVKIIDWAFDGCTSLTEISIPSSVTSIGQNSFYGCTSLKTVRINSTKATCHHLAFMNCNSLERIIVPNATTIAKYLEDEYFNYYNGDKICAEGYCGVDDANDGKNVKWSLMPIADEYINFGSEQDPDERQAYALTITKNTDAENANLAMKDCPEDNNWYDGDDPYSISRRIKTATIEKGITNIGTWAFSKCVNLESVAVPSTVAAIGEYAFYNCKKLACVNIPEGVTSIGEWTFESCESLTSVDIPSTVTNIDERAFGGCTSLKTIHVKASTPPTIEKYGSIETIAPFYNCTSLKNIIVPNVDAYSAAYGWNSNTDDNKILPLLRADKTTLFAQDASNTYMTWCDQFEWKKPEGCTVYTVSGVNSEQVQVAEVEGDLIPAYTPVLIKRTEGKLTTDIKAEFSNVVESVSTSGTSYMNINKDTRAYQGTVIASYDGGCVYGNTGAVLNPKNYGWVVNDEYTSTYALYSDKFLMIDADEGIPTHRFIMRVSHGDVGKARSLTIGVGGDTTGMEELKNEKIEELNSEWYDLQGRRLDSKPTQKGLYINNGKKIVIK